MLFLALSYPGVTTATGLSGYGGPQEIAALCGRGDDHLEALRDGAEETNARKGDMIEVRTHPVGQRTFPPIKFIIGPDGRLRAASVASAKVIEAWEADAR